MGEWYLTEVARIADLGTGLLSSTVQSMWGANRPSKQALRLTVSDIQCKERRREACGLRADCDGSRTNVQVERHGHSVPREDHGFVGRPKRLTECGGV